jgi:uncharacterized RDD family membrane protein YckC
MIQMIACPSCAKANEDHAVYCQGCGSALKPITVESAPAAQTSEEYGGFWIRFLAWIIDTVVVSAAVGFIVSVTFGAGFFVIFVAHWLYEALLLSSSWQATLGKRALNLVVTDPGGRPLSFGRASGRHFAKWLSTLIFGIGYIIAAFTSKKQALHDMVAGTVVVRR